MLNFRAVPLAVLLLGLSSATAAADAPSPVAAALAGAVAGIESEPQGAVVALEQLRSSAPHLDDVLDYHTALARLAIARNEGAAALAAFRTNHPRSVLFDEATARLAEAWKELGRRDDLTRLADSYARRGAGSVEKSAVCLAAAETLAAEPSRSLVYFDCARRRAPRGAAARTARAAVDRLFQAHPELAPTGADGLWSEAELRGSEGDSQGQARLLDRFLALHPGDGRKTSALLARAKAFDTKQAGAEFLEMESRRASSAAVRARLTHAAAYAHWNANDDQGAMEGFQRYLTLRSDGAEAGLAHYAIGRIHESAGRTNEAIAAYGKAAAIGSFDRRVESRWRQGWAALRAGRHEQAVTYFKKMADGARRGSDDDGRAEALYWQARALEKAGRAAEAGPLFDAVLAEFPDGYYAAAVERHRGTRPPRMAVKMLEADASRLDASARRAWLRARDLGDAGLVALALADLDAALDRLPAAQRRALLPTLEGIGASGLAFHEALGLSRKGLLTTEELRPYLYPRAQRGFVEEEARARGLDPIVVWSLMRQESAFDAGAVSPAQAIGLMQLLESTAARMAPAAGVADASRARLFDPRTNIRLGTTYLAGLTKEFGGRTELALAAYNAGETAAARWAKAGADMDIDELIESISYRETRDYVKKILRNVRNYRRVWG